MNDTLTLNPFATIAEVPGFFLINTIVSLQVRLGSDNRGLIEFLLSERAFSRESLRFFISEARIDEFIRKRILIHGAPPPLEGRYSRQLGFFSLTVESWEKNQEKLQDARVLILGAGAIGTHVAWSLAAIGVGSITIVDCDTIEETNLNRQLLYNPDNIGSSKADTIATKLQDFNPQILVTAIDTRIVSSEDMFHIIKKKTMVIKAIDTPEQATEWLNGACVAQAIPYISGGFIDHVGVIGPCYQPGKSMCYACSGIPQVRKIAGTGATFAPLTGVVAAMIALQSYNMITASAVTLNNSITTYDPITDVWSRLPMLPLSIPCSVCGREPDKAITAKWTGTNSAKLWAYRAGIIAMIVFATAVRLLEHDNFAGAFLLIIIMVSLPLLYVIVSGNIEHMRREMFVLSCIYGGTNGFIALLIASTKNMGWRSPFGLEAVMRSMQVVCLGIVIMAVLVAALFLSLDAVRSVTSYLFREKQGGYGSQ